MNYYTSGWLSIIVGSIVIAFGGVLTTKGWSLLRLHSQKKNLIRAVAKEWLINGADLKKAPFRGPIINEVTGKTMLYPLLRTSAINSIVQSGFWNFGNEKEGEFLLLFINYEDSITKANEMFGYVNADMVQRRDEKHRINVAKKCQEDVLGSDWYATLKTRHEQVGRFLRNKYRWVITDQYLPEKKNKAKPGIDAKPQE